MSLLETCPEKIDWIRLSSNPNAMHLLTQNPDKICWTQLSRNPHPHVIQLLTKHIETRTRHGFLEEVEWNWLSAHPHALPLLTQHPDKINWKFASSNPHLLPLFEKHVDRIEWDFMCCTIYPELLPFLEKHMDRLCNRCWYYLSSLPLAMPLLLKYPHKIRWCQLSRNPAAIPLLEKNPEKIDWHHLSANPAATHLLFRLDYSRMRETNALFREELLKTLMDPERLGRMSMHFGIDMRTYIQYF
jgi:hypothetical protein